MIKHFSAPKTTETIKALWKIQKKVLNSLDYNTVVEDVVNSLLSELGYLELGYRIIVLTLVDEKEGVLKRISLSQTEEARQALEASVVPFHEIDIPLSSHSNLLIQTLRERKVHVTHYWPDIFKPVLSKEQALHNQRAANIKTSVLYPVLVEDKAIGVLIFSMIKNADDITEEERDLIQGFTEIVGLAVQNARLYSVVEEKTLKLKIANDRLKELDKLKDDFVSIASHELRTPMTAIKSYLWMALNKANNLEPKINEYLTIASISTDRLINLVANMLTISRIEGKRLQLVMKEFILQDLIQHVSDELSIKAKEQNIHFEVQVPKQDIVIIGDSDKLHEVIQNLAGNALKFTPSNGSIIISAKVVGKVVEVSVKDTGPGMSKKDQSKLFQKFGLMGNSYSKTSKASGTGLGLYITKQILMLHKGHISVKSELGKGSIFSFTLPL